MHLPEIDTSELCEMSGLKHRQQKLLQAGHSNRMAQIASSTSSLSPPSPVHLLDGDVSHSLPVLPVN